MKTVIYITGGNNVGFRKQRFDWSVGDTIRTEDGKESAKIVKVVDSTQANLKFLNSLISKVTRIDRGAPVKRSVGQIKLTVGYKTWIDEDARVSYFLKMIEAIK